MRFSIVFLACIATASGALVENRLLQTLEPINPAGTEDEAVANESVEAPVVDPATGVDETPPVEGSPVVDPAIGVVETPPGEEAPIVDPAAGVLETPPVEEEPAASPVAGFVEAPVAAPIFAEEAPVAAPVAGVVEAPVAAPIFVEEAPVAAPVAGVVETPIAAPITAPVAAPVAGFLRTPTRRPVVPYVSADDIVTDFVADDDTERWFRKSSTIEEMEHDRSVMIALSIVFGAMLSFGVFVTSRILRYPNGCWASTCKATVACLCGIIRCICYPCRSMCGCTGPQAAKYDSPHSTDDGGMAAIELS
eukprot:CAMPEP_0168218484 /NCGR_PEP_ID=MMETSP0140_2-20121125/7938_1 /TAXON_ID=44445 /ORGANISM="Pseudo-nitzschia australis, Strain 10249 10 AB" /LENGTH=306 /DNA_ID=CAMNT_0008146575 /DNA_START=8 /DNA_END=928 /DNA_ORIENTATION=+